MRKLVLALLLMGFIALGASAQKEKKNNCPAVIYSLPKTVLVVEVKVSKIVQKAGPYYRYGEHYLALKDVITEDKTTWEVSKVNIYRKGIADDTKTFQLKKNSFVSLNDEGVICGINWGSEKTYCKQVEQKCNKKCEANSDDFLSNLVLTEDQLVANSTAKMAESAAKQIYRIRDSRISLISGENDKIPADGESLKLMLKKLDQTEKSLIELFAGKTTKTTVTKEFEIIPDKDLKNEVLFRISGLTGIVDKDDLSGSPVYINLSSTKNDTPPVKTKKGIGYFYNLPGSAKVKITNGEKDFFNEDIEVSEFGSIQKLPCKLFKKSNVKVKYNSKTGAIINIEK